MPELLKRRGQSPLNACKKWSNPRFFFFSHWVMLIAALLWPLAAYPTIDDRPQDSSILFRESLQQSILQEKENIEKLTRQFESLQNQDRALKAEIKSYGVQIYSLGNLLLQPDTDIESLNRARADQQSALKNLSRRLPELSEQARATEALRAQCEEQNALVNKQIQATQEFDRKDTDDKSFIRQAQTLAKILSTKCLILEKTRALYSDQIAALDQIQQSYVTLSERFEQKVQEAKKQSLFQRKPSVLDTGNLRQAGDELQLLSEKSRQVASGEFWRKEFQSDRGSEGVFNTTSCVFLLMVLLFLFRCQRRARRLEDHEVFVRFFWLKWGIYLLRKSLPLIGTTLFIYFYAALKQSYESVPMVQAVVRVLLAILLTGWGFSVLRFWSGRKTPYYSEKIRSSLWGMLVLVRYFTIVYLVFARFLDQGSITLQLLRFAFELILLGWVIFFWKRFSHQAGPETPVRPFPNGFTRFLFISITYTIFSVPPILELAGYEVLAIHWLASWGKSAAVLLWAGLLFLSLREWNRKNKENIFQKDLAGGTTSFTLQWLMIRFCAIIWLVALSIALLFAWGAKENVIVGLFRFLNYPLSIGNMQFSLTGFIYALIILLLTHAAARLWAQGMGKIFQSSGLEPGLQASIKMISVYFLWGIGILIMLHVIGFSTTSIAVAFGGLGIGLGFGLQNIFNNFISGIILLFERPIQVGDAVEINGVWGEVKKINVRATIVQTYDNASLIIPNSEFISSQVTNWSFKDLRLRRKIPIGVAYGSDTELVRRTLLEIAEKNKMVHRTPKPDVLFSDFADSALVFILRIWTDLNHMLAVETDIRFEIDRLFRKRGIEIAFPQRDIHIRSIPKEICRHEPADMENPGPEND